MVALGFGESERKVEGGFRGGTAIVEDQDREALSKTFDPFTLQQDFSRSKSEFKDAIREFQMFNLDKGVVQNMLSHKEEHLRINIPIPERDLALKLTKADFLAPGFVAKTSSGRQIDLDRSLFYWGVVEGSEEKSSVTLVIGDGEVSALITLEEKVYKSGEEGKGR